MLLFNMRTIGNKLLSIRKRLGLTQSELAERAGLSDRTYADIERGTANMRIDTALRICEALHVTPDEIFTDDNTSYAKREEELFARLADCTPAEKETAMALLSVYLDSLKKQ